MYILYTSRLREVCLLRLQVQGQSHHRRTIVTGVRHVSRPNFPSVKIILYIPFDGKYLQK